MKGRRGTQDKKPWKAVDPPQGAVEAQFIRPVLLGESIAPFRTIAPFEGIIPIEEKSNEIMSSGMAAARGFSALASWLTNVESLWQQHGKGARTFVEQLNFFEQLSAQLPTALHRVVYAASGTNPAAAVIRDNRAIVEHKLYWGEALSEAEAWYLVAILNSETTRARAEKWQSVGQWGARDFDKVVFNLPIPKFDASKPLHRDLSAAGERAERLSASVSLKQSGHFTRARKQIRDALIADGIAARIESMVAQLLDT